MELLAKEVYSKEKTHKLAPFGDLQIWQPGYRQDIFDSFVKYVVSNSGSISTIGMGDYWDYLRPSRRKTFSQILASDPSTFAQHDKLVMASLEKIAQILEPLKPSLLGLLQGHHRVNLSSGMSSDQMLAQILGVPFLGVSCLGTLMIRGLKYKDKLTGPVTFYATHGEGSSKFISTDLGHLERGMMPLADADIYMRGHSTTLAAIHGPQFVRMGMARGHYPYLYKTSRILVNTGGFMESYVQGKTTYPEEKVLKPSPLGWAVVKIRSSRGDIITKGVKPKDVSRHMSFSCETFEP